MSPIDGGTQAPRIVLQAPGVDGTGWMALESPSEILVASALDEVRPTLSRAVEAAESGLIVGGFVSYEAAPAFDAAMLTHEPDSAPLAWFAVFETAELLDRLPAPQDSRFPTSWQISLDEDEYAVAIQEIHRRIASGDTYQVNFTLSFDTDFQGDHWNLFRSLCRGQRADCCAYVDTGDLVICSASPELFFHLEQGSIRCKPMKGTAPRGRTLEEDLERARWLSESAKNQAENVMIVDMVRHDLGRIAVPGTVEVSRLWELEKFPSLYQLTSTVEARTEAGVNEIFAALFPCASITGAPKIRAMEIINGLEKRPRGVYTGAIGVLGPGRRAHFNVAIRTVQIDCSSRRATYGTGGGIVWDSAATEEWAECQTKALVLRPPAPDFELLETLRWDPEEGFLLLDRHLERLAESAAYFDFSFFRHRAEGALIERSQELPDRPHRIRLLVDPDGELRVEASVIQDDRRPWELAIADTPVDRSDPFLFHKTTHRQIYTTHRERHPECDDVLLWNERREITESTLANVVIRFGHRLLTPPVSCGLLAGTFRAELLDRQEIAEAPIALEELGSADEILLINSVRRWIRTRLDTCSEDSAVETRPGESA